MGKQKHDYGLIWNRFKEKINSVSFLFFYNRVLKSVYSKCFMFYKLIPKLRFFINDLKRLISISFPVSTFDYNTGAQFEGDLGEILILGAEMWPYIALREKGSGTPRPKTISARDSSDRMFRPIFQSGTARPPLVGPLGPFFYLFIYYYYLFFLGGGAIYCFILFMCIKTRFKKLYFALYCSQGEGFRDSSAQNHFDLGLLGPDVLAHFSIRDRSAHFFIYLLLLLFFFGGGGGGGGAIYCFILFMCIKTRFKKLYFALYCSQGKRFRDSSAQNHFGPDVLAHFSIRDCSAHFSGTARPIFLFIYLFFFGGGGQSIVISCLCASKQDSRNFI